MSLFCPVKGLNCLMFSPFYRFGHPGLRQNNIVASPVALTVSVNTCWAVALPYLVTSATSASKLCGIFIPPEDLWWPLGDLHHWINALLTPVDQHKLDPWSWQIYHHDPLFLKHPPSWGVKRVWAGWKQRWWLRRAPSISRSKVKLIKVPGQSTRGAAGERSLQFFGEHLGPRGWHWCLGDKLCKTPC